MKLSEHSRIAVIGAGALGSELCRQIADGYSCAAVVVDADCLQERNISLSRLYLELGTHAMIDRPKVEAVYQYANMQGRKKWEIRTEEVADVGVGDFTNINIIFSCVDHALARIEIQRLANLLDIPLIDGGLYGTSAEGGRVTYFARSVNAACYLCGIQEQRRAELLAFALSASLGCALPAEDVSPMGSGTSTSTEAVARTMLRLAKETLDEEQSFALRLTAWGEERVDLRRSASCGWHTPLARHNLVRLPHDQPLIAYLQEHAEERLELEWPLCVQGRCSHCGTTQMVLRRVAWTRRSYACAACGRIGTIQPLRVVESVGIHDPEAEWSSRQLGLPEKHLFQCRKPIAYAPAQLQQEMR